ncbi:cytochrome-c peroxidase [Neolewinella aurantiaca]|nr:cytochrome c peroxidase [Neolewinella aurantiaca]
MKSLLFVGKALLFSCSYIFLGHFLSIGDLFPPENELDQALFQTTEDFHSDLSELENRLTTYAQLAANDHTPVNDLREIHTSCREQFKRTEFLLEYIEPATVRLHLNGAPLPKTEPSVPEVVVIEPGGLQTLDEMVSEPEIDRKAIANIASKLLKDYQLLYRQVSARRLQHRHVFEGAREEILRIFTLGVTGFDTPGTGAALPESRIALQTIAKAYAGYSNSAAARAPQANARITEALQLGDEMLATNDFDGFDRLRFLREVINPLTENLPRVQAALEIESIADYTLLPHPVNPQPSTLFDADFLNADYYANLSDSPNRKARLELGELLFFDPILSNNLKTSCASCHQPGKAFTDGRQRSLSNDGKSMVQRNAPTLVNSVFAEKYFHDLREEHLERQMNHVVANELEFATDFITIEKRLRQSEEYKALFAAAYADQPKYQLSKWSISDALSNYVMSLRSQNSVFDRFARGESEELAEEVRRGFNVFMGKATCGTCHFAPTFSGLVPPHFAESESEVLGVPADSLWTNAELDADPGRIANRLPRDEAYFYAFAFKTPTVRNIAVTGPYMHNGVYTDLRQVMEFYNLGGGAGIGINVPHQTLPGGALNLSETEIADVITFMESLTDYESLNHTPAKLPSFPDNEAWNNRKVGGDY